MKLGVMQGRLSEPVKNQIQLFPKDTWKKEFSLLGELDLNHIEWIVTPEYDLNPGYVSDLKNYPIHTVCADTLLDERFLEHNFIFNVISDIGKIAIKNDIKFITIPLMELSNVNTEERLNKFIEGLTAAIYYFDEYDLSFSIEAEADIPTMKKILSVSDRVFVTYDLGNMTSFGIDHRLYIEEFIDKINNVHIKDRTKDGQTVEPLTGDTEFSKIFKLLKEHNYDGVFTLQTARGQTGKEFETIKKHKNIFERLYNE